MAYGQWSAFTFMRLTFGHANGKARRCANANAILYAIAFGHANGKARRCANANAILLYLF
ncbi:MULTISPECIES: hypothetical protein [Moorena]|uniref:hypothetical protein n=1 Tax=Moorena TaxID=1155738 RepID=UPI00117D6735|nr:MULTISPECIES: hypothetical protein [Moorena]NEO12106.1 hypothetical protein [Moorena sp. SIO3E8]NEP98202.1 hypothetical protein [Moorena sp. SIO3F7]